MATLGTLGIEEKELPIVSKSDPHILEWFTVLALHRKKVIFISFLGGALLLGFGFLMPVVFESQVTILPPEKQSGVGSLMSFLAGSSALDMMKSQENPALDLFKNILDSRMAAEEVADDPRINRYLSTFDTSKLGKAGMLHDALTSEPLRNGMLNVTVDLPTHWLAASDEIDSARKLSAYVANLFVSKLDKFNRERLSTTAHNTRVFVESQYQIRMHQLDSLYTLFQQFQEEHKTISLSEQLNSTVSAAAMLAAQLQQNEIQLGVEERELSPNSSRMQTLKAQIEAARDALKKYDDGSVGEYSIALRSVPELSRRVANFTREIKLLEQVSGYLRQQLEQERINEQRSLPSLQVLDNAIPPQKKSSPHKLALLILGCIVGFAFSIFYVSMNTYYEAVRTNPEEHRRYLNFVDAIRGRKRSRRNLPNDSGKDISKLPESGSTKIR